MSENNPDILIPSLKEFIDHLNKWNYYASEAIRESEQLLSVANDCTNESKVMVTLSENQVLNDFAKVENEKNDIKICRSKCDLEKSVTTQLLNSSKSSLDLAFSTLNYWEEELRKTTDWVHKATKRLEDANINYETALVNLETAKNELESAKEQLGDCLSDGKRLCIPEFAAVAAAQIRHINALMKRKIARVELREAGEDLNKANSCLINCEKAHKISLELVPNAQSTYNSAIEANELMDRSLTDITSAESISQKAEGTSNSQKECLNETIVLLNDQIILNNEAEIIQLDNLNLTNSSQDLALGSTRDLESRIESLTKFAQPAGVQKSDLRGSAINTLYKSPVSTVGSILASSLILGPDASSMTASKYMALLAAGKSKIYDKKLPEINQSGIFNKTGPEIKGFSIKNLENKLGNEDENILIHSESHKILDEKLIKGLPLFTTSEQKYILDKQSINNQYQNSIKNIILNYDKKDSNVITRGSNPYFAANRNTVSTPKPIKSFTYVSPYTALNEKVKNTAKDIFINRGSFEVYYDPIGKAIDDAEKKEFPGSCVLSPNDKHEIRKAMEFEQYQHPTYLTQSIEASLNNNYNSIRPLY